MQTMIHYIKYFHKNEHATWEFREYFLLQILMGNTSLAKQNFWRICFKQCCQLRMKLRMACKY